MEQLPLSIIATIAVLTVFLSLVIVLKYAVSDHFTRTRALMTLFFFFIVTTLTISYSEFFFATLPYTIPAGFAGAIIGYLVGVRSAEQKLAMQGAAYYMEHFAHIHLKDVEKLSWWSLINYYTVVSALALINLVGLTTVIFHNLKPLTLFTSAFGAFLIGSIAPYLLHLWSISVRTNKNATRNISDQ